jgi:hypothetical protein
VNLRNETVRQVTLVRIPLRELSMPRRTLMVYREQGYVSDSARELIKIVRAFNWDLTVRQDIHRRPATRPDLPSIVRGRRGTPPGIIAHG